MTLFLLETTKLLLVLLVLMARGRLHADNLGQGGSYMEPKQNPSVQNPISKASEQTPSCRQSCWRGRAWSRCIPRVISSIHKKTVKVLVWSLMEGLMPTISNSIIKLMQSMIKAGGSLYISQEMGK